MTTSRSERTKLIAYWITTILGPASFVIGGVLNLTQTEQVVSVMTHLGYPAYFGGSTQDWRGLDRAYTFDPWTVLPMAPVRGLYACIAPRAPAGP